MNFEQFFKIVEYVVMTFVVIWALYQTAKDIRRGG